MRAASTKSTATGGERFCRGLSVPRSPGRRGHVCVFPIANHHWRVGRHGR